MERDEKLLAWAGGLSIAAAIVHGLLTDDHFEEWWGYGLFFAVASLAQGLYGLAILGTRAMHGEPITRRWRPGSVRAFLVGGVAGNLLLVALYVVTRTSGIPIFGPEAGETEPWEPLGILTKALELAIAATLVMLLSRTRQGATVGFLRRPSS